MEDGTFRTSGKAGHMMATNMVESWKADCGLRRLLRIMVFHDHSIGTCIRWTERFGTICVRWTDLLTLDLITPAIRKNRWDLYFIFKIGRSTLKQVYSFQRWMQVNCLPN